MELSTIYWFGKRAIRHPLRAANTLYSYYTEIEAVKTAKHPLGEDMSVLLPSLASY